MNAGALWNYAVALYSRDGVKTALLDLQARRGADIDLLLWCCWCAETGGGAVDDTRLRAADDAVASWRESVTRALRAVRDGIGKHGPLAALDGAAQVRERVLLAELDAERVALGVLEQLTPAATDTAGEARLAAAVSLGRCCRLLAFEPDEDDTTALLVLLAAAFDTAIDATLRRALHRAAVSADG